MRFYHDRCEAMRNFANKIWNATRFVMMNLSIDQKSASGSSFELPQTLELEDKWIVSRLNSLTREVCENLDKYELGVAAAKIYDFIWDTYCDWYIELSKPRLQKTEVDNIRSEEQENVQKVLLYVLTELLALLHPFMPFITEEIWQSLPHPGPVSALMVRQYPKYNDTLDFPQDEAKFESIMAAIRAVRSRRSEMNVPPSKRTALTIVTENTEVFEAGRAYISRLAYANELNIKHGSATTDTQAAAGTANTESTAATEETNLITIATNDARIFIPLSELVDITKERERIDKEIAKVSEEIKRVEQKLANEQFTSKAPENVVQAERDKLTKHKALLENLNESKKS
jgi:valyl-tRNA synthetase